MIFFSAEPVSDWAEQLTIPVRYSGGTNEAIKSGLMTRAARVEINNALATLMMVYTMRPSPDEMHTVCRRLVQKYPKLKDSSPTGYVSASLYCIYMYIISVHPSLLQLYCPADVHVHCM